MRGEGGDELASGVVDTPIDPRDQYKSRERGLRRPWGAGPWDIAFAKHFLKCQVRFERTVDGRRPYCACPHAEHNAADEPEKTLFAFRKDMGLVWYYAMQIGPDHVAFWRRKNRQWECHLWMGTLRVEGTGMTASAAMCRALLISVGWTEKKVAGLN